MNVQQQTIYDCLSLHEQMQYLHLADIVLRDECSIVFVDQVGDDEVIFYYQSHDQDTYTGLREVGDTVTSVAVRELLKSTITSGRQALKELDNRLRA